MSDYALLSLERALVSWCKLPSLPAHDALAVLRRLLPRLLPAPPRVGPRTMPLPEPETGGPAPTVGESKGLVRGWLVVCKALLQVRLRPPLPSRGVHRACASRGRAAPARRRCRGARRTGARVRCAVVPQARE